MHDLLWLIPALPLAGFGVLLVAGRRLGDPAAGWLATLVVAASFGVTVAVLTDLLSRPAEERVLTQTLFTWVPAGALRVGAGLLADPLSVAMALFVTGVGSLIHLYAIGYMRGDPGFSRFFTYLNLFVFSMLTLVLADNFLLMFLGWEGVGVCSYFLISFWFERPAAATAGKKAFVTNRVGDWGFMLAIFLVFSSLGTVQYAGVFAGAETLTNTTATAIALLFFVGAVGKSAQLPLYLWLPDAMEGPTPVSALIHAATMVTAGVYLMVRISPILELAPAALTVVATVGVITAFFAAAAACAQDDIKRVLAYSTISQLGFMFLAVGSKAYVAAVFHMVTHAFFKALLFLGGGSVIHGLHEEQDMKRMGGLRRFMPLTAATFIAGWLAIAGIPPFAGFWSKDEILLAAWDHNRGLWALGVVTAVLTAYYMSRQVFLVFFGEARWTDGRGGDHGADAHATPHEAPPTMAVPLVVLGVLSVVGGALNLPWGRADLLTRWLEPVVGELERHVEAPSGTKVALALGVAALAAVAIAAARAVFVGRRVDPARLEPELLRRAWFVDAAVSAFMGGPGRWLAERTATVVDAGIVDGAVNGVGVAVREGASRLRRVQTGYVRNYALALGAGTVGVLAFMVARAAR
jgi:NADH-quinone oxidoreductase subunit L